MMRKGTSLLEVIVLLVLISSVTWGVSKVFHSVISDIPRRQKIIQTNSTLQTMLVRMQQDVDKALTLPTAVGGYQTDPNQLLLIQLPDEVVIYRQEANAIVRYILSADSPDMEQRKNTWQVPKAQVQWELWKEQDTAYAVEIRTGILYDLRGAHKYVLSNSHVFFLNVSANTGPRQ